MGGCHSKSNAAAPGTGAPAANGGQPILLQEDAGGAGQEGASGVKIPTGGAHGHAEPTQQPAQEVAQEASQEAKQEPMQETAQEVVQEAVQEDLSLELWRQRVVEVESRGSVHMKVMTYNLFWWNLYGVRKGDNASASKLVAAAQPDMMGCQECDDISRVLIEGALQMEYKGIQGPHSLGIAYKATEWEELSHGFRTVATDEKEQFYGDRGMQWARLQHKQSQRVVFFVNHHGPLRINSGGRHGGPVTAQNIVRAIHENVQPGDAVIMVGDFNAQAGSQTVRELERYLPLVYTGLSFGGVDHFFTPLQGGRGHNKGGGGSDHDALLLELSL